MEEDNNKNNNKSYEDFLKNLDTAKENLQNNQSKEDFLNNINKVSANLQDQVKGMSENEFRDWSGKLMESFIGSLKSQDKEKLKATMSEFISKNKDNLPPIPEGKKPMDLLFK